MTAGWLPTPGVPATDPQGETERLAYSTQQGYVEAVAALLVVSHAIKRRALVPVEQTERWLADNPDEAMLLREAREQARRGDVTWLTPVEPTGDTAEMWRRTVVQAICDEDFRRMPNSASPAKQARKRWADLAADVVVPILVAAALSGLPVEEDST